MSKINLKAYIPSANEFDELKEKFPAFASANVSEKAKMQGTVFSDVYKNKGCYLLRSAYSGSSIGIDIGHMNGTRKWDYVNSIVSGLRLSLSLKYNANSSVVKSLKNVERTTEVWAKERDVEVKSVAPVVNYGGIDYIWTNKEECEAGKSNIMNLTSLDLVERAMSFDFDMKNNDFAKAKDIHMQCEVVAFENATEEEKAMAVEVEMSSENNYQNFSYVENEYDEEKEM